MRTCDESRMTALTPAATSAAMRALSSSRVPTAAPHSSWLFASSDGAPGAGNVRVSLNHSRVASATSSPAMGQGVGVEQKVQSEAFCARQVWYV